MRNIPAENKGSDLRKRAEELHKKKKATCSSQNTRAENLKLLHELEVHQIELELQNEELSLARAAQADAWEKYIELYDFAPSGYLIINRKREINEINLTGANMLGEDRSHVMNRKFDEFISSDKETFDAFLEKVFNSNVKNSCEVTLVNNEKTSAYVELTGIASQDRNKCQLIINDITAFKKAEQVLINAKELAETSDRLKSVFLATMSHELRTPLNSVIGFSGILLNGAAGELNEEQRKQITLIQKSGRHLLSLITDILDISKIEAGQLAVNYELINIPEVIEEVLGSEAPFARSKEISLIFQKPSGISEIVSDRKWIRQVLFNLVNNAIKFSEKGSVSIDYAQNNQSAEIRITDTGIGIKEKDLESLFQPFSQVDNSLTRKYQGSGLGLSITKKLIEALDGTITMESEYGKGTTFIISVPVNKEKIELFKPKK